MSTHKISEHGNGLPEVGERVYSGVENAIYTVESINSNTLTRQYAANYILATLAYDCDPTDLEDDEFEALRDLRIERAEDGCEEPDTDDNEYTLLND